MAGHWCSRARDRSPHPGWAPDPPAAAPEHPYSPAFVAGETAYVSGAFSVDDDSEHVHGETLHAAIAQYGAGSAPSD